MTDETKSHPVRDIPDQSDVLLNRLSDWKGIVESLIKYVDQTTAMQKEATSNYTKLCKTMTDIPKFEYGAATGLASASDASDPTNTNLSQIQNRPSGELSRTASMRSTGDASAAAQGGKGLAGSFIMYRNKLDELVKLSGETEANLQKVIRPQLENLLSRVGEQTKEVSSRTDAPRKEHAKCNDAVLAAIDQLSESVNHSNVIKASDAKRDPYLVQRETLGKIDALLQAEHVYQKALRSLQDQLETFESNTVESIQRAMSELASVSRHFHAAEISGQDAASTYLSAVPLNFEWKSFSSRTDVIVTSDSPKRTIKDISFPNLNAPITLPIADGVLRRKEGTLKKSYKSGFYVLTQCKFLHQYENEDYINAATPVFSLYLPDCTLGPLDETSPKHKFKITGKSALKTLTTKHSFSFKANSAPELVRWYKAIENVMTGKDAVQNVVPAQSTLGDDEKAAEIIDQEGVTAAAVAGEAGPNTTSLDSPISALSSESSPISPISPEPTTMNTATSPKPTVETDSVIAAKLATEAIHSA
ncbi:hypothetical protein CANCADRAFT_44835 [Tortispora caseinolytica NRRL Y-17796]|uniref:PH domain-containing protein n=1 Tax=Tortispora caseinolytica NRRL Y-17796 TaxID=767744 RepID=A0A1E4THP1_9ASCO|nr:hypothetical protein CANCADRAFT_44835 [Tortispora caseinolytica NRRL Y-17796]